MATHDRPPGAAELWTLFDESPATEAHTSPTAMVGFLCGLGAALTAPFSVTLAVALFLGTLGVVSALAGVVGTSRPLVAGRALAPLGMLLSLGALGLLGLRYLHVDTAFGDALMPTLLDLLDALNARVPAP